MRVYDVLALLASGADEAKTIEGSGSDSKDIRACLAQPTHQASHSVVAASCPNAVQVDVQLAGAGPRFFASTATGQNT